MGIYLENCINDSFFGGELRHFGRSGIEMEYCTCKKRIKDCEFWKNIYLNFHQNEIGDFNKFKIMFESNFKFQNLILKKHKSDKYLSLLINLYSLIYKKVIQK